jgi:hypothetical protein
MLTYTMRSASGKLAKNFSRHELCDKLFVDGAVLFVLNEDVLVDTFAGLAAFEAWETGAERAHWLPKGMAKREPVSTAVNPSHYKGYVEDMQWLDTMSRIPTLRDPSKFEAAVELQIRKYLDRNGQKDASIQELLKAKWYLDYLIAYKKAGRTIKVHEVEELLKA